MEEKESDDEVHLWPRTLQSSQLYLARSALLTHRHRRLSDSIRGRRPLRDLGRGFTTPDHEPLNRERAYERMRLPTEKPRGYASFVSSLSDAKASLRALAAKTMATDAEAPPSSSFQTLASVDEDTELSPGSVVVAKETMSSHGGEKKSTVTEAILNMTNILLGTGLLALPYAARCVGGYVGVTTVLLVASVGTLFTAKILGRELRRFSAKGFPDLAFYTFGRRGRIIVAVLLYADIFMCLVLFLIMGGTNLAAVFDAVSTPRDLDDESPVIVKAIDWVMSTPKGSAWLIALMLVPATAFDDLSTLSKFSAVGTIATISLVLVVTIAAIVRPDVGESSSLDVDAASKALSIGLVLYCFAGHALFPSIYFSLEDPARDWDFVVDVSYAIVGACCVVVACAGYLLFGDDVSDQISVDIAKIDKTTGIICCALIAISAVSKFALELQPVAMGIEELVALASGGSEKSSEQRFPKLLALSGGIGLRVVILGAALICAVSLPAFAVIDSLLGAVFATLISIVFPCAVTLHENPSNSRSYIALCITVIVIGCIAGGLGTWGSYAEAHR